MKWYLENRRIRLYQHQVFLGNYPKLCENITFVLHIKLALYYSTIQG